jgi:hypothetical protein
MWMRPIRIEHSMRRKPIIIRRVEADMMMCFLAIAKAIIMKIEPSRYRVKMIVSEFFVLLSIEINNLYNLYYK